MMRNLLAKVPRASTEMVAAAVRTIFARPDGAPLAKQRRPTGNLASKRAATDRPT